MNKLLNMTLTKDYYIVGDAKLLSTMSVEPIVVKHQFYILNPENGVETFIETGFMFKQYADGTESSTIEIWVEGKGWIALKYDVELWDQLSLLSLSDGRYTIKETSPSGNASTYDIEYIRGIK